MLWLGGLVSVTVVVAAGVGLLLRASRSGDRKERLNWIKAFLFGKGGEAKVATK